MPRSPTWINRVNFVTRFLAVPCGTKWYVYLEVAGAALGNVVLSLLSFGVGDMARGFFKPKGLRSQRHGRKGRKSGGRPPRTGPGRGGRSSIPEIGEIAGSSIPGAEKVKEWAGKVPGSAYASTIDAGIQRGLYYWMILDVFQDYVYELMLGIVRSPQSDCQGGRALGEENDVGAFGDGWYPLLLAEVYEQLPIEYIPGGIRVPAGVTALVIATWKGKSQIVSANASVGLRLVFLGTDVDLNVQEKDITFGGEEFDFTVSFTHHFKFASTIAAQCRSTNCSTMDEEGSIFGCDVSYYIPE